LSEKLTVLVEEEAFKPRASVGMVGSKSRVAAVVLEVVLLLLFVFPVFAVEYKPGVSTGNYVMYGNFFGINLTSNQSAFQWMKIMVIAVSGNVVTLQTTGQLLDGSPMANNSQITFHNVETGATNDTHSDIQIVMAANLNQGDVVPLARKTLNVIRTEMRVYNGTTRVVNVVVDEMVGKSQRGNDMTARTTYVYDKASGMCLETEVWFIVTNEQGHMLHWSVVDTNIFNMQPPPAAGALVVQAEFIYAAVIAIVAVIIVTPLTVILRRKHPGGDTKILENKVMELTYNLSGINRGESYLSNSLQQCLKIVSDMQSRGVRGLSIIREDPESLTKDYNIQPADILMLSAMPIKGVRAVGGLQDLSIAIMKFLKSGGGVVLLDGLTYLISRFGFNTVYMCLQEKKIEFLEAGAALLVPVIMDTLDSKEKAELLSELKLL
jgi:hypothetical protein